jgi:rhodanese-related sulfurtransferase
MERTIAPTDVLNLIAQGAPIALLDVRRAEDRARDPAAIPGAAWHDPTALASWAPELGRDREIVLYCVRGGSVSNSVLDALRAQGLQARYIEGGLEGWKAAGGEVTA